MQKDTSFAVPREVFPEQTERRPAQINVTIRVVRLAVHMATPFQLRVEVGRRRTMLQQPKP